MRVEPFGKPDAWKLARPVWGWGRGEIPGYNYTMPGARSKGRRGSPSISSGTTSPASTTRSPRTATASRGSSSWTGAAGRMPITRRRSNRSRSGSSGSCATRRSPRTCKGREARGARHHPGHERRRVHAGDARQGDLGRGVQGERHEPGVQLPSVRGDPRHAFAHGATGMGGRDLFLRQGVQVEGERGS